MSHVLSPALLAKVKTPTGKQMSRQGAPPTLDTRVPPGVFEETWNKNNLKPESFCTNVREINYKHRNEQKVLKRSQRKTVKVLRLALGV